MQKPHEVTEDCANPADAKRVDAFLEHFTEESAKTWTALKAFDYDTESVPVYAGLHKGGPFLYPADSYYLGQYKNNLRHGRGKCSFASGSFYEGEWYEDKPHGRGRFITPGGDWYLGNVNLGFAEGKGRLTHYDGVSY